MRTRLNRLLAADTVNDMLTDLTPAPDIGGGTQALRRIGPLTPDLQAD